MVERSSVEYPNILFSGTCSTKIMCKVSHVQHKGQQRSTCLTVNAEVTLCSIRAIDDPISLINARYDCTLELHGSYNLHSHDWLQNDGRALLENCVTHNICNLITRSTVHIPKPYPLTCCPLTLDMSPSPSPSRTCPLALALHVHVP